MLILTFFKGAFNMKKQTFSRRPNNSGTVVKLSGKRRKPFIAKVTTGYDEIDGSQKQTSIGSFATRQEALEALSIYSMTKRNNISTEQLEVLGGNSYKVVSSFINRDLPTFEDIFTILYDTSFTNLTTSRQKAYKSAFKRLQTLHAQKINDISLFDLQDTIDKSSYEVGDKVLNDMKTICVKVFEYAVIHQYIKRDQDFTNYIQIKSKVIKEKEVNQRIFTNEEIQRLMALNTIESKIVLTYILTGCRPNELWNLKPSQIHLHEIYEGKEISYLITGSKTNAGKNRCVPIHKLIEPYITEVLNALKFKNQYYYRTNIFEPLMSSLNMLHIPYDTRHTFATLAKLYKVDDFSRKRIMGHKSNNITDDVYTHTLYSVLYEEINKIKIY